MNNGQKKIDIASAIIIYTTVDIVKQKPNRNDFR